MKKATKMFAIGVVAIGIFGASGSITATADVTDAGYIPIPNKGFRENISTSNYELMNNYGVISKSEAESLDYAGIAGGSSLEGIESMKNLRYIELMGGENITDFRRLSSLKNVDYLFMGDGYSSTSSLDFLKDWNNLFEIDMSFGSSEVVNYEKNGDNLALTDISALNGKEETLSNISLKTKGNMSTISLNSGYRKHEIFDPIILSDQFDTINYSSTDSNFTNTDGLLSWNDIPEGTESLNLKWEASGRNFSSFNGDVKIPIVWK